MRKMRTLTLVLFLLGSACGADSHEAMLPYKANETEIIGGNDFHNAADKPSRSPSDGFGAISVATPDGDECAELDGVCVNPQTTCGDDGRADVLIDANGAVVNVICYPTGGIPIEEYEGPVADVGNNVVLVLDANDDGVDVMGDVTIDGNNVFLFGSGPRLGDRRQPGDRQEQRDRARRAHPGQRRDHKNNPSLVDCLIEGDLHIVGNNTASRCARSTARSGRGQQHDPGIEPLATPPKVLGQNLICNDNASFADNEDGVIDEAELGARSLAATRPSSQPLRSVDDRQPH